jgi:Tfp pilus assembly protein PilO
MNLPKIDITDSQKKIIIIALSVLFIFFLFWLFLFFPASKEIAALKNELISTSQQIKGIEILLAGAQSRDEAILSLEQKQQYLSNKFPQKEEESLRLIPEIARKMNINVISLQPGSRTELLDETGKQIVIEDKLANYLPITLELSCYFKDLVKYALELKAALPAFTIVNSLGITREDQLTGKIRANIEFNLYLLE